MRSISVHQKSTEKARKHFIHQQKAWILRQPENIKQPFLKGGNFYYLAKAYTIDHHNKGLELYEEKVYLNPLKAKQQSDNFYKEAASKHLPLRILMWKEKMNVEFTELQFRCAKRRWGSCN